MSKQQKAILLWLLGAVRDLESSDREDASLIEGIVWNPHTEDKERENCWRASLCRALARLETRGLITRIKGPKNARTIGIRFTQQGRRVAESISGN